MEIGVLNEYQPEDNNFFGLSDEVNEQLNPEPFKVVKRKERFYVPRKPIPKKIRQHLTALRGFACENCQENSFTHIHHIDGNPANNQLDNLRLLCLDCHKLVHAQTKK